MSALLADDKELYQEREIIFPPFRLDLRNERLLRGRHIVSLRPKSLAVLRYLLERPGQLVKKEELLDAVWPESYATDVLLKGCIKEIRRALHDDPARPRFIETAHRRGYRFIAQVTKTEARPAPAEGLRENQGPDTDFSPEGMGRLIEEIDRLDEERQLARTGSGELGDLKAILQGGQHFIADVTEQRVRLTAPAPPELKELNDIPGSKAGRLPGYSVSRRAAIIMVACALAAVAIAVIYWRFSPAEPARTMTITRLPHTGNSLSSAISRDGKYVVHRVRMEGEESLWLRQVATSSDVQIMPPGPVIYTGLSFSPDGNHIYYTRAEGNGAVHTSALHRIPVFGGVSEKLLADVNAFALSPDGRQIAFVRRPAGQASSELRVATADGAEERQIAARDNLYSFGALSWSPDGKQVACPAVVTDDSGRYAQVYRIRVADGAEERVSAQRWHHVYSLAWLADDSLVMSAQDQPPAPAQVWQLALSGGQARRVTHDLNNYSHLSATGDGTALLASRAEMSAGIWVVAAGDDRGLPFAARARRLAAESNHSDGVFGLRWLPDGRAVYIADAGDGMNIYSMQPDGSARRKLTASAASKYDLAVSPDGRHILFVSNLAGTMNIWKMDVEGETTEQLTFGKDERTPAFSPDGKWVIYNSQASGRPTLWKVPFEGGDPVQLTDRMAAQAAVSPDGRLIACLYRDDADKSLSIAVLPFAGGSPTKLLNIPASTTTSGSLRWAPDGSALTYAANKGGASNIYSLPLAGGHTSNPITPKQLTDFKTDHIFTFDWSRDGKQLLCSRGSVMRDFVLITDFR